MYRGIIKLSSQIFKSFFLSLECAANGMEWGKLAPWAKKAFTHCRVIDVWCGAAHCAQRTAHGMLCSVYVSTSKEISFCLEDLQGNIMESKTSAYSIIDPLPFLLFFLIVCGNILPPLIEFLCFDSFISVFETPMIH